MFSDPQSITINSIAVSLAKVSADGLKSTYRSSDGIHTLVISHQIGKDKRVRSMYRLDKRAIVANPLDSTDQDYDNLGVYVVIDRPEYGFDATAVGQLAAGVFSELDSTALGKLFGLES
jgi:hypothetical protein